MNVMGRNKEVFSKPGEYKTTLALFQRYTPPGSRWSFGFGHSDVTLEHYYCDITKQSFEERAGIVSYKLLGEILNDTNNVIGLGSK
jgi:hypothetical protein